MYLTNLLKAGAYPSDLMTVMIGLVVVFAVLIVLTFVFWVFGKVVGGKEEKPTTTATPAVSVAPKTPIVSAPIAENGVTDEVVAVISAAIAAMSDSNTTYVVRRIRPAAAQGVRPVWAVAGIADNTRPF